MIYFCNVFIFTILLFSQTINCDICNNTNKKEEFPSSEEYEVRPNLFINQEKLLGQALKDHKKEFTYGSGPYGPSHWPKLYPKCGGKHQSPINIDIASLKTLTLPVLKWNNVYEELPEKMSMIHSHNTLILDISYKNGQRPTISGGPLPKNYAMKSLHFHWSSSDHKGSEHTINKKSFPMEMHVVHYRADLNFSNAVAQDKGLCVVAYIFELTNDKCNEALSSILSVAEQTMLEKEIPVDLTNMFRLDSLVDKIESDYVTYPGSLTTPPCHESVVWIVSPFTITVAKKQMEKFRAVSMASSGFGDNYRPIQPLNDRCVTFVKCSVNH